MTDEQVGKYIRLLCLQHQKGRLTEKDMFNICKTYDIDVFNKFIKEGDIFYNERLEYETIKRKNYAESRRKNREGKKKTYVKHMENENENENRNKKESIKKFIPPTVDEVKAYTMTRPIRIDAQRFVDYYTGNGWKVGKNKMVDWQAAVRTWERNTEHPIESKPKVVASGNFGLNR